MSKKKSSPLAPKPAYEPTAKDRRLVEIHRERRSDGKRRLGSRLRNAAPDHLKLDPIIRTRPSAWCPCLKPSVRSSWTSPISR
jgi:hypothetical protein